MRWTRSTSPIRGCSAAFYGLLDGLRLIALANAFGRGLLAPGESNWRIYDLGNRASRLLFRFLIAAATIWGVERLVEAAADATASLNISIAARATAATLIALAAAATLRQIAHPAATPAPGRDPWAPARTLAWAFTVLLLGAALTGYIAFATFLIRQTFFVFATASVLFIVDTLIRESTEIFLKPDAAVGHGLMTMIGLRRELSSRSWWWFRASRASPRCWRRCCSPSGRSACPARDILATARAAYFGFTIGGLTISISSLIAAVVMFMVGLVATRAVQNWLSERYLPRTRLDAGVSNSIRTITGYVGVAIALLLGGARLGLDLQKFAIVAGALSVGIGFGLQSIANNFVSGLILLWERGIRVGDWVVVGGEQGFVRRINARATEIETFDRSTLIVPNSTLVTGTVKNWMYNDRIARIIVSINVDYEADPEAVREMLIAAAKGQELVLSIPAPLVMFSEFGDWALKFQLICYVDDALMAERTRSELNFDILRRMREAGMRTPYPYPTPRP